MSSTGIPAHFLLPTSRNLRAVFSGALHCVGLPSISERSSAEDADELGLNSCERVCVVLVDGMGVANLTPRLGHAPTLRSWTHCEPLTSVAPSTTATAITALGTGYRAGRTSMLSYALRSPSTGENFSLIKWEDPSLDPRQWQRSPTIFEVLEDGAEECLLVQPQSYIGSGLSICALRGVEAAAADTPQERIEVAARALRAGKRFVYLYWGELDRTGHAQGWQSEAWVQALEEFDVSLRQLARRLPSGTRLLVTADHGMIDVSERLIIEDNLQLASGVDLISGEERFLHLYTHEVEAVAERWREEVGESAWILTKEEACATGIFGEVSLQSRERMGDVLVILSGHLAIASARNLAQRHNVMVGVHGSFTPEEMEIPWIIEDV